MDEASDRLLVERTRGGQVESFGEIVRRYQTSVYNVCLRVTGDPVEAEDLAQEAFLRAFRRLGSYDVERPFGPWMRKLAANLSINAITRRGQPQVELDDEIEPTRDETGLPEPTAVRREQEATVRKALLALPAHYRAVLELRHYQEMSYDEIGRSLDLSPAEVKTHLYRARRAMARLMSHDTA